MRPGSRLPHVLLACYLTVCLLAFLWPVYPLVGNRVEPMVLGLPFTFAWNIGWVLATFVVLGLYYRFDESRRAVESGD